MGVGKRTIWTLIVVAMVILLAGCGEDSGEAEGQAESQPQRGEDVVASELTFAYCSPSMSHPFFQKVGEFFEQEAIAQGVDHVILDAQLDTSTQIAAVEDLITQGVDMIFLTPTDGTALGTAVLQANEAGIPVITVSRDVTEGEVVAFVGSDDRVIGQIAGNFIATKLGGRGKVVELTGTPGATTAQDRSAGFNMVIDTYPDIELVAQQTANYHRGEAMNVMENIIQAQDEFDAMFAANDEMAGGAIQALESAGRLEGVIIVGCNTQEDAIEAMMAGKQTADITFPPQAGREAVKLGLRYLQGEDVPSIDLIPVELVVKENVDAFEDQIY